MFTGINVFWAWVRLILAQAVKPELKMNSEKGSKYIYAEEHKLYYYYYHFEGHWTNKKKITSKWYEEYSTTQRYFDSHSRGAELENFENPVSSRVP